MSSSLASRSITSFAWKSVANWAIIVVSFIQSIYLTRVLAIETFGQYTYAWSIVLIGATISKFGSGMAFAHRSEFTEDERESAEVLQTFKLITNLIVVVPMILGTLYFAQDPILRTTILVLIFSFVFNQQLLHIPSMILYRRVDLRRLAILDFIAAFLAAVVAIIWATVHPTVWVFLAAELTKRIVHFSGFYLWKPFWIPRWRWDRKALAYYFRYGGQNLVANSLLSLLDRIDDLWSGFFFGTTALGIYSRAYKFATYPRQIVAQSVNTVVLGTYAELKQDRLKLSKAFFRANAFLIRSGFLIAGFITLAAPEFIELVLTDKWLPMLPVFRLMLVFTLLDPLKVSISHLFVAVGHPGINIRARIIQLCVLLLGLLGFSFGLGLEIIGVALAVNCMLVVGISILLYQVQQFVDISIWKLFFGPTAAIFLGISWTVIALEFLQPGTLLLSGFLKIVIFGVVYLLVLVAFERTLLWTIFDAYRPTLQKRWNRVAARLGFGKL